MNSLVVFPGELTDTGEATLRAERRSYAIDFHELGLGTRTRVAIFGGKRGYGVVTALSSEELKIQLELNLEPLAALEVIPLVAVCRPQTIKKVILSAAIFGVPELHFFGGERSQKSYFQSKALLNDEIERQIALGLEQVWNSQGPEVFIHRRVQDALAASGSGPLLLADELGAPISSASNLLTTDGVRTLCGPELGWSENERAVLSQAGATAVRVSNRSLRLEIAFDAILGVASSYRLE
jgi:RsmE family RNA methyltransferase